MAQPVITPMLILGSGPAGLTAAIYGARAGFSPVVIQGLQPGGQLTTTSDVENYPGFAAPVVGPQLMEQMQAQALSVGSQLLYDTIVSVDLSRRPFRLTGDGDARYQCDTLIIATGAQARWLGLPGEERLRGAGVSACATCDGPFFQGKEVVVIGGGNTAVEEALQLARYAQHVTLIHRRDSLRAEKILQERLFANPRITLAWNSVVEEFLKDDATGKLRGVTLIDALNARRRVIACAGAFVAIGHRPATELFRDQLAMDADGYIVVEPGATRTSQAGVFACGDVQDRLYRQAVTAAGTGCMAALDAARLLSTHALQAA